MKKIIIIAFVALSLTILAFNSAEVGANPSQILENKSAAATTTITYMTPGAATTTNAFDTQGDGGFPAESGQLALQVTATSTGVITPTVVVRFEDSQDGIDWYPRAIRTVTATTSLMTSDPFNEISLKIATSTTAGFGGSGTAQRYHFVIDAQPTMRYVRAVIRIPIGGGNVGMWSNIIAKKQNR